MRINIFETQKKYRVIYADPPWQYSSKRIQREEKGKRFHSLNIVYNTMPTNSLKDWGQVISNISEKDSVLFMWATDSHLPDALELIKSWGFKYVTVAFIWKKVTKNGKLATTLGAWTLKGCELCLFATKGTVLKYKGRNDIKQLFEAERTKHSKKPDIVRTFIMELFPNSTYLELFAREEYSGWDSFGDELPIVKSKLRKVKNKPTLKRRAR